MSKKKSNVVLSHTVICDDIRREDTGKLLLIGVYPDSIQMNIIPAQIAIAVWLQFEMSLNEKTNFEFEFKGGALEKSVELSVPVEVKSSVKEVVPILLKVALVINKPGSIAINYRSAGEKDWEHAHDIQIRSNKLNS